MRDGAVARLAHAELLRRCRTNASTDGRAAQTSADKSRQPTITNGTATVLPYSPYGPLPSLPAREKLRLVVLTCWLTCRSRKPKVAFRTEVARSEDGVRGFQEGTAPIANYCAGDIETWPQSHGRLFCHGSRASWGCCVGRASRCEKVFVKDAPSRARVCVFVLLLCVCFSMCVLLYILSLIHI